jgi:carbon storage regulator
MLVLSIRQGRSVVIDGNIEVFVCSTASGKARLGFRAPKDVRIERRELIQPCRSIASSVARESVNA